jgi:hypothetical protein
VLEFLQVEGKRRGGQAELIADVAGRHPVRPGLDQKAVDIEARLLCKRS